MLKIFIGPHEIAGYYANLAKGFKQIGIDCDYLTYTQNPLGYGGETKIPLLLRIARFFNQFYRKPNRSFILKVLISLPGGVLTIIWVFFALFKYDVFIFGFGHSLIPKYNWDIPLLKKMGKIVIMNIAHGSDARPSYIDGAYQSTNESNQPTPSLLRKIACDTKKHIQFIEKKSNFIIGAPFSTSQFTDKKIINWFALGVPFVKNNSTISSSPINFETEDMPKQSLRILHSPSHPVAKGTPQILKAIQNLKEKGHSIEFVMLHGKPHSEVIREIQQCDFVIDQIYSDTPLAGFATEAAWFGKPAVVGGYGFDYLKNFVSEDMWPPSKICHPDDIEQAIESLIVNREERLRLGTEVLEFVHEKWNAAEVARRYLKIIEGDIPDEWWLDPRSVTYLEGGGQPLEYSKQNIRQMVEQFGVESLQLSHRPDLEHAFLEFAGVDKRN